jgi:hypothetical protein
MPAKIRPISFVDLLLGRSTRSLLAAAAMLALAITAPAKADETIGLAHTIQRQPICRDYDNAVEAERLVSYDGKTSPAENFKVVMGFIKSHQGCEILDSDETKPVAKVVQLPEEKIALCISLTIFAMPARCDYWMIVRPTFIMRNFDLQRTKS